MKKIFIYPSAPLSYVSRERGGGGGGRRRVVYRPIYVNVDSPNLGFPHFDFLGEAQ